MDIISLESLLNEGEGDLNALCEESVGMQMEAACIEFADSNDLCEMFDLAMESTDVTFEGYGKYITPIKFKVSSEDSMKDVIKRLKDNGADKLVKALIPVLKKEGYNTISSEAELKKLVKEYENKHPIKNAFFGHPNDKKTTASSGWLGVLGLLFGIYLDNPFNSEPIPIGGTVVIVTDYVHWTKRMGGDYAKKRGGAPSGCYAVFWNPEKEKFRMVTIARQKFFNFGGDKPGVVKN